MSVAGAFDFSSCCFSAGTFASLTLWFSLFFNFQTQVIEFAWETIMAWEVDDEGMAFCLQYHRADKPPRWVRIYTPYYVFMCDCFDRVQEERKWAERTT